MEFLATSSAFLKWSIVWSNFSFCNSTIAARFKYSHNFSDDLSNYSWSIPYIFFLIPTISSMISIHSVNLPWISVNSYIFLKDFAFTGQLRYLLSQQIIHLNNYIFIHISIHLLFDLSLMVYYLTLIFIIYLIYLSIGKNWLGAA